MFFLRDRAFVRCQWPHWSCTCRSMFADMRELFIWSKLSIAALLVLTSDSKCRLWELDTWEKTQSAHCLTIMTRKAGLLLFFNWETVFVFKKSDVIFLDMSHPSCGFYSPAIPEIIFALTVASLQTGRTSALWLFPKSHVPVKKGASVVTWYS